MVRSIAALIALTAMALSFVGCETQTVIKPQVVKTYSVELEFVLAEVVPAENVHPPSEAPTEPDGGMTPVPPEPVPPTEPSTVEPEPGTPTEPSPTEPGVEPGPEEPPVEPVEPVAPKPKEIERVIYTVRQTLAVGDKIEVDRSETVMYKETVKGFQVDVEGRRQFTVSGTSKAIGDAGMFLLVLELLFVDDKLKMNYTCSPSLLLSATGDSEQILAESGNLRVKLICRKGPMVEYEKK
jgi:hypothetical protein